MPDKTTPFDAADYLDSPEMQIAYIEEAFDDGDPALIALAIGNVARKRGVTAIAQAVGLTSPGIYKAFGASGNPRLTTLSAVLKQLGLRLKVEAA